MRLWDNVYMSHMFDVSMSGLCMTVFLHVPYLPLCIWLNYHLFLDVYHLVQLGCLNTPAIIERLSAYRWPWGINMGVFSHCSSILTRRRSKWDRTIVSTQLWWHGVSVQALHLFSSTSLLTPCSHTIAYSHLNCLLETIYLFQLWLKTWQAQFLSAPWCFQKPDRQFAMCGSQINLHISQNIISSVPVLVSLSLLPYLKGYPHGLVLLSTDFKMVKIEAAEVNISRLPWYHQKTLDLHFPQCNSMQHPQGYFVQTLSFHHCFSPPHDE